MLNPNYFSGLVVLGMAASMTIQAQPATYPTKTIRMVVGFAPGGGTDVVARVIGAKVGDLWGHPVVIDNRGGVAGTIGADIVAKAPPDGYTLLMGHVSSHAVAPNISKRLPFDPLRDFTNMAYVGYVPNVLVVHPSIPARNVQELVTLARAKPASLSFASSGVGSTQHLAGEMLTLATGIKIVHVPYKGSGPAVIDLLAGHVAMNFDSMPPVLSHVRQKKLRALAVTTPKRAPQLAAVPTMLEAGIKDFEMTTWFGVMGPANLNRDIVGKWNTDVNRIAKMPEQKTKLEDVGMQLDAMTPDQFSALIKSEIAKYARIVKDARVSID